MKRSLSVLLVVTLTVCVFACGIAFAAPERTYISIGTAGSGGYFFSMGAAITNIINKNVEGVEASAESTGGSSENATLVGDGELEMGMANGNIVYAAYHGQEPYEKEYTDIRSMFAIQSSVFQLVTMEGNGINSISDLKGKRVVVGPSGGGQVLLFAEILSHYGMTLEDMTPVYIAFTDGTAEMLDGNCDAVVVMAATPTAAMVELGAKSDQWRFIEFDPDILEQCIQSSSYFLNFNIEAGTYNHQAADYHCIAASSVMMVHASVADDVVYAICEAVYNNLPELVNTVDSAREMALETGSHHPVALHPGAEKFFKDKGVLK